MAHILESMRVVAAILFLVSSASAATGRAKPAIGFEVASVRPCRHIVGPDYNNHIRYLADGIVARNVTLRFMIAEAYRLQIDQVSGPDWLNQDEYDVEARTSGVSPRRQMDVMLRRLLADRFNLKLQRGMRRMRVYELMIAKSGPKIHAISGGEAVSPGTGFHFRGDMRRFADLLAVQFSIPATRNPAIPVRASEAQIPVIDKTGLAGIFDFSVDVHPELGTDSFTMWKRALPEQLGLKIESGKEDVPFLIVDRAAGVPTAN